MINYPTLIMYNLDAIQDDKYKKSLEKARQAKQRQTAKILEKQADPKWRKQQFVKKRRYLENTILKQKIKQASPEYRSAQFAKLEISRAKKFEKSKDNVIKRKQGTALMPLRKSTKLKSMGLKGRNMTAHEKEIVGKIVSIGCVCCLNKTFEFQDEVATVKMVSPHHCDGRIKKYCHYKVLPLCQFHHQVWPPAGCPTDLFPIHGGGKKNWYKVNGSEEKLLMQVYRLINVSPPWLSKQQ